MLFSRDDVARFINQNFEPTWEMVRAVPMVRIDFGNGTVITRTLHGNIATSVCTSDGDVVDILPGIYTPDVYLQRLREFRPAASYLTLLAKDRREVALRDYHRDRLAALIPRPVPPKAARLKDMTKRVAVENRMEIVLASGRKIPAAPPAAGQPTAPDPALTVPEDLADWKLLAQDTQVNEKERRRQIHEMLGAAGLVKPQSITRRLYKEVLHADLDDPYLGLGPTLFANYPFAKEEARP